MRLPPLVLAALVASGCVATEAPPDAPPGTKAEDPVPAAVAEPVADARAPPPRPAEPRLSMDGRSVPPGEALAWSGDVAEGGEAERALVVEGEPPAPLVVLVRWALYTDQRLAVEVRGPDGARVAAGSVGAAALGVGPSPLLPIPGSAAVAIVERPAAGAYAVVVRATQGAGAFEAAALLRAPDAGDPARDALPNLVTLPPMDLRLDHPQGAPGLADAARGCGADETADDRALRCLRFSNGVGNLGEGALEMRLPEAEGPAGLAGQGRFVQRVHRADGSFHDEPAGMAVFHPFHGHFHYSGAAAFRLHAFDLDARERGDVLKETRKTGFCFADFSLVTMDHVGTTAPRFDASGCLDPLVHDAWVTGLSPNWYDRYHWTWFDQYVDVTGVPDGVYELVSVVNEDAGIRETRLDDNEASAVLRLTGSAVEVLWTTGAVPAAP